MRLPQKYRIKTPTTSPPSNKPQYHNYYTLDHKLLSNLQRYLSSNMPLLTTTTTETAQQNTANTAGEFQQFCSLTERTHRRKGRLFNHYPLFFFHYWKTCSSDDKPTANKFQIHSMCFQKNSKNLAAANDLASADSIVTAKWNIQYPLFYSESCIEHLFPTGGMAWNNPLSPARQMTLCSKQEPNCS